MYALYDIVGVLFDLRFLLPLMVKIVPKPDPFFVGLGLDSAFLPIFAKFHFTVPTSEARLIFE